VADTGLPWELPYPLPTDLVRDGADAIKDLAEATATGLSSIPVLAGIGSNVESAVGGSFSTTSGSYVLVTGSEATITLSSATSKVLVIASVGSCNLTADVSFYFRIHRGGAANGSEIRLRTTSANIVQAPAWAYIDSPASGAALTYDIRAKRDVTGTLSLDTTRLVLIEVAP